MELEQNKREKLWSNYRLNSNAFSRCLQLTEVIEISDKDICKGQEVNI